jgi:murein DD-endopeptidase MepM/ murein hydrolase activator NlpD
VRGKRLPIALCLLAGALLLASAGSAGPGFGASGAGSPAVDPGASAQSFAIKIAVPGQPEVSTTIVSAPPSQTVSNTSFASTGVASGATAAGATTQAGTTALATASSDVAALSLFGGEITADGVSGRARASAGPQGAVGDLSGSGVSNLVVLGKAVTPAPNLRVPLADWGYAIVLAQGVDQSAPDGAKGYRGFVTGLDVHLNADHGGLPAGTEILVGYAEAAAMTAPPAPTTSTTTTTATTTTGTTTTTTPTATLPKHLSGGPEPPGTGKVEPGKTPRRAPPKLTPKLTAGGYVFPVYGNVSYGDTFGAERGDIASGWHHGDDIFGQLGQPLLAVADGQLFSVGWNEIGGNRLWLRDRQGNQFYYAHLSAFSTLAVDGAHVKAGDVIGFMGNSGDAQTTPYHLHFEIHPVSLLYLDYDGAVDPTTYLDAWRKLEDVDFPTGAAWAPSVHGGNAPEPGAILLQVSDISSAAGLDPESLRRAQVATASG